jgi:hypothetical protein
MHNRKLELHAEEMNEELLQTLEERNLIRRFRFTERCLAVPEHSDADDILYTTKPEHGPHTVVSVGFHKCAPELAYHTDHEDFLLFSDRDNQKPLYILVCLCSRDIFAEKKGQWAIVG